MNKGMLYKSATQTMMNKEIQLVQQKNQLNVLMHNISNP